MAHEVNSHQIKDFLSLFNNTAEAIAALQTYSEEKSARTQNNPSAHIILSIKSLSKVYSLRKQRIEVLKDVTLDIHQGEFVAITGASGSGKSTLLQLIGGIDVPSSGQISIDGVDINHLSDGRRSVFRNQTIGFVFQFFYLQPFLRLKENVAVPGMFARASRRERRSHVSDLLEKVGLSNQEDYLPKQLSGGQIQRAAIARALLNSPKILLADEPTGNLDSANSESIIKLFKRIRDELGTTIIIVTHNPEIAAEADREIRLQDGAII